MWYCLATFPNCDHPSPSYVISPGLFIQNEPLTTSHTEVVSVESCEPRSSRKDSEIWVISSSPLCFIMAPQRQQQQKGRKTTTNVEQRTDGWQKAISVMRVSSPYRQWCSCSFSMLRFELPPSVVEGKTGKGCWWWRGLGVDMWRRRTRYEPCFWWL